MSIRVSRTVADACPGLYIAAFSLVAGGFNQAQHVTVTVATSQPVIAIDVPAANATVGQPFSVSGWALDLGAPSCPGVTAVHVHAVANGGAGAFTYLGSATIGQPRPDVAAYFGHAKFTNSGYSLTASGLAPGYYQIRVYLLSEVSGQWTYQVVYVTVS